MTAHIIHKELLKMKSSGLLLARNAHIWNKSDLNQEIRTVLCFSHISLYVIAKPKFDSDHCFAFSYVPKNNLMCLFEQHIF